ncbi:hypothetical protein D3C71_2101380 [compost metagenome]
MVALSSRLPSAIKVPLWLVKLLSTARLRPSRLLIKPPLLSRLALWAFSAAAEMMPLMLLIACASRSVSA